MKTNKLKLNVFLVSIAILIGLIHSCYDDETSNESNQPITTSYNETILSYLSNLKSEAGKENGAQIEALKEAINLNTIHIYDLKSTEKLLIADISTLKGFESYNATKAIFFVYNNKITHSKIVTAKYDDTFNKTNQVIIAIFNQEKNKVNCTGTVSFYNILQKLQRTNDFENGILKKNSSALPKNKKTNKSYGCTDWYWVTTYSNGSQKWEYLYTTCIDDCVVQKSTSKSACGGGGGGGDGTSLGPNEIVYPSNPNDGQTFVYIDRDGEIITKEFNAITGKWDLVYISLPPAVVTTNSDYYFFLIFEWPVNNQTISMYDYLYTYDAASGYWVAEPETPENIAKAIEEQINDSQLDPCTKAIMEKLKNSTEKDIAKMITRFTDPKSIFKINMSIGQVKDIRNWAETTPEKGSQTDINMVFKYDYINGIGNTNRPTDLSIATTMAHEIIHAYLISLLEAHKSNGSNGSFDFPTIYEAYVQQQITKNPNILASEHHELIAKQYVFAIATTIQEFHTGQYTDYPYQDYIDLAWGGLTGTTIFNTNFPNDLSHKNYKTRERILNRINAEKLGLFYQNTTPLGTPCKK